MALFFRLCLGVPPLSFSRPLYYKISHRLASSAPIMKDESSKPFSEIPTPSGAVPLLGHYFLLRSDSNFSELCFKMFQEVGGPIYRLNIAGSPMVITDSPSAAEIIYRNEGKYPSRGKSLEENMQWFHRKRNEDTLMPFESGTKWQETRRKHGKQLIPANVLSYIPGFNRATDRLIRNIKELQDDEGYVNNIEELITYWSLEVGAYFSLGADLDAMRQHREEAVQLKKAVATIISATDDFIFSLPFYKYFPTRTHKNMNTAYDEIYRIGIGYADQHMERIEKTVSKGEKELGQSLLEQWLIEGKMGKDEAVRNAVTMVGAGMDTTAHTISFTLYELSKHRSVQDKLYNQVISALGETGEPDTHSLQKMPYLMHTIKEAQSVRQFSHCKSKMVNMIITTLTTNKIYVIASGYTRVLSNDSDVVGYSIPAGTLISYNGLCAGQNEKNYKNPHKYDPDRWTRDDIHPFSLLPFGVGTRSCWGRRFAEIEMKVLLSKLSQHYIMESDDPPEAKLPVKEKSVIRPAAPICIKFTPRK